MKWVNLLRLAEKEEGWVSVAEESALQSAAAWLAAEEERLGELRSEFCSYG
jgi:hypothetical protein